MRGASSSTRDKRREAAADGRETFTREREGESWGQPLLEGRPTTFAARRRFRPRASGSGASVIMRGGQTAVGDGETRRLAKRRILDFEGGRNRP